MASRDSRLQTGCLKGTTSESQAQLPHLVSSLAIPGLPPPPPHMSPYADEAAERLTQFMNRWNMDTNNFAPYSETCVSCAAMLSPGVQSSDRLTAIAMHATLFCILDDACFDPQSSVLREILGIDIFDKPQKIRQFATNLDILFRQNHPPHDASPPSPVEGMWWEIGQEMRRLSNPRWFSRFADEVLDYWNASIECHIDGSHTRDLESYTRLRSREFGGYFMILQIELARNAFLPDNIRELPAFQQVINAAAVQIACVNDIFSYPKEIGEANARNLIKVLMGSEGLELPDAAWEAVGLANSYSRVILELEKELPTTTVGCFMDDLKCWISGHICWLSKNKRYRCPDSPFPELQDVTITSYDTLTSGSSYRSSMMLAGHTPSSRGQRSPCPGPKPARVFQHDACLPHCRSMSLRPQMFPKVCPRSVPGSLLRSRTMLWSASMISL